MTFSLVWRAYRKPNMGLPHNFLFFSFHRGDVFLGPQRLFLHSALLYNTKVCVEESY